MNTRVFKDISKYQHRAWLGFTTRQVIFVLPALAITILVLGLNLFLAVWGLVCLWFYREFYPSLASIWGLSPQSPSL